MHTVVTGTGGNGYRCGYYLKLLRDTLVKWVDPNTDTGRQRRAFMLQMGPIHYLHGPNPVPVSGISIGVPPYAQGAALTSTLSTTNYRKLLDVVMPILAAHVDTGVFRVLWASATRSTCIWATTTSLGVG